MPIDKRKKPVITGKDAVSFIERAKRNQQLAREQANEYREIVKQSMEYRRGAMERTET